MSRAVRKLRCLLGQLGLIRWSVVIVVALRDVVTAPAYSDAQIGLMGVFGAAR